MKYSLRSLMIAGLLGLPLLAGIWFVWESVKWRFEPSPRKQAFRAVNEDFQVGRRLNGAPDLKWGVHACIS
jgi:hypothetical protein